MKKTKGQLEAEVSEAIVKFEKEYMGRGPLEVKTYILDNMVLVRSRESLLRQSINLPQREKGGRAENSSNR